MAPALPHGQLDPCSWRGCVTSDAVAVSVVDLFDGAVAEGQFAHPVDSAADAGGQAQTGVGGRCVEAVRPEIVIAQVLAVVVGGDVVNVHLIAFLQIVEEEVSIG